VNRKVKISDNLTIVLFEIQTNLAIYISVPGYDIHMEPFGHLCVTNKGEGKEWIILAN
jgi:hypothetical protein